MHWVLLKRSLQSVSRIRQSFPINTRSISAPNCARAKNNKVYYEKIIRNRTLTEQQQRHSDSVDRTSVPMRRKEKTYIESTMNGPTISRSLWDFLLQVNATRQASLFCRYRHNNHPYLILQPVKEEQLLDQPGIFMFHDLVSHADIDEIKALASPRVSDVKHTYDVHSNSPLFFSYNVP